MIFSARLWNFRREPSHNGPVNFLQLISDLSTVKYRRLVHSQLTTDGVFAGNHHAALLGEADSNDAHEAFRDLPGIPHPALEAENSASLGKGDLDNLSAVSKAVEEDRQPPLDAQNVAFLGEADSDDGFEAIRAAEGEKHEPMYVNNAAFLGEADSNDAQEAEFDIDPKRHRQNIEDTRPSSLHGQEGGQEQSKRIKGFLPCTCWPDQVRRSAAPVSLQYLILSRIYRNPLSTSSRPARSAQSLRSSRASPQTPDSG